MYCVLVMEIFFLHHSLELSSVILARQLSALIETFANVQNAIEGHEDFFLNLSSDIMALINIAYYIPLNYFYIIHSSQASY